MRNFVTTFFTSCLLAFVIVLLSNVVYQYVYLHKGNNNNRVLVETFNSCYKLKKDAYYCKVIVWGPH